MDEGRARSGVDVIVKPPGLGRPGRKTSSHWPGRNYFFVRVPDVPSSSQ